jgi:hypothetical protein
MEFSTLLNVSLPYTYCCNKCENVVNGLTDIEGAMFKGILQM